MTVPYQFPSNHGNLIISFLGRDHHKKTKREELFITTKVWIQKDGYKGAMAAFEKSLSRLQLEYIDLYLIHQPYGDVYGTWRAMEELYEQGKIRAIGISNFPPDRVVDLVMHNKVVPAVILIENHPFYQKNDVIPLMKEYGIAVESWGPFAEGKHGIFKNETLVEIANKRGKSVAQVILRWLNQREVIAIPKSTHTERMLENFEIFDFVLDDKDMDRILALDMKESSFFSHIDPDTVKRLCQFRDV